MEVATLKVTPIELAYINRLVKADLEKTKNVMRKVLIKPVLQKIQDAIISF